MRLEFGDLFLRLSPAGVQIEKTQQKAAVSEAAIRGGYQTVLKILEMMDVQETQEIHEIHEIPKPQICHDELLSGQTIWAFLSAR